MRIIGVDFSGAGSGKPGKLGYPRVRWMADTRAGRTRAAVGRTPGTAGPAKRRPRAAPPAPRKLLLGGIINHPGSKFASKKPGQFRAFLRRVWAGVVC